jgi:hypothetical protein
MAAIRKLDYTANIAQKAFDMRQQMLDSSMDSTNPAWRNLANLDRSVLKNLQAAAAEPPQLLEEVRSGREFVGKLLAIITKLPGPALQQLKHTEHQLLLELHTNMQRSNQQHLYMPILSEAATQKGAAGLAATAADMQQFFKFGRQCCNTTRSAVRALLQELKWLLRFETSSKTRQLYLGMCSSLLTAPSPRQLQYKITAVRRDLMHVQQQFLDAAAVARVGSQLRPDTEAAAAAAIARYQKAAASSSPSCDAAADPTGRATAAAAAAGPVAARCAPLQGSSSSIPSSEGLPGSAEPMPPPTAAADQASSELDAEAAMEAMPDATAIVVAAAAAATASAASAAAAGLFLAAAAAAAVTAGAATVAMSVAADAAKAVAAAAAAAVAAAADAVALSDAPTTERVLGSVASSAVQPDAPGSGSRNEFGVTHSSIPAAVQGVASALNSSTPAAVQGFVSALNSSTPMQLPANVVSAPAWVAAGSSISSNSASSFIDGCVAAGAGGDSAAAASRSSASGSGSSCGGVDCYVTLTNTASYEIKDGYEFWSQLSEDGTEAVAAAMAAAIKTASETARAAAIGGLWFERALKVAAGAGKVCAVLMGG